MSRTSPCWSWSTPSPTPPTSCQFACHRRIHPHLWCAFNRHIGKSYYHRNFFDRFAGFRNSDWNHFLISRVTSWPLLVGGNWGGLGQLPLVWDRSSCQSFPTWNVREGTTDRALHSLSRRRISCVLEVRKGEACATGIQGDLWSATGLTAGRRWLTDKEMSIIKIRQAAFYSPCRTPKPFLLKFKY